MKIINKRPGFSHVVASHLGLVNNPGVVVVIKEAQVLKKRGGARKEVRQVEMNDFFNFLMERYQEK